MNRKITGKRSKVLAGLLVVLAVLIGTVAVYAAVSDTAGTDADPVVTKSYVDRAVEEVRQSINYQHTEDESPGVTTDPVESDQPEQGGVQNPESSSSGSGFHVIELKKGETLTGYQNTEIVVRAGEVKTVIPGENGISDLTAGHDLLNDAWIQRNHLLIVPRSDGRGVTAVTDAFVMIQGSYKIER